MKSLKHIKAKAIVLRKRGYSLDEITKLLSINKSTIFYWIRRTPKGGKNWTTKERKSKHTVMSKAAINSGKATVKKWELIRNGYYQEGTQQYEGFKNKPLFKEFLMLFITEGWRKDHNTIAIANTNPTLIRIAKYWLERIPRKTTSPLGYYIQRHLDQKEKVVKLYWSKELNVSTTVLKTVFMKNSGKLRCRNTRSPYGTITVRIHDTKARMMLQSWVDAYSDELNKSIA